jgi:PhzF family phenazine biosynthesis protein
MSQTINVNIINAFTDSGAGGNPAGVVLEADALTREMKQQIAAKVGMSETAFVSKSQSADFKLEFFTPTRQIPHCGHATIATFSYLYQQGLVDGPHSSKETIDGNRDIFLKDEVAYMEQLGPVYLSLPTAEISTRDVLASLDLFESSLPKDREPMVVNTGNSFLIIPLRDEATLKELKPDFKAIEDISKALDLVGYYAFTTQTRAPGHDAAARMFAPYFGIQEEAATGMAAGPLACYLHDHMDIKKTSFVIEQGRLMPVPSPGELLVDLTIDEGHITRLIAGGRAKVMRSINVVIG